MAVTCFEIKPHMRSDSFNIIYKIKFILHENIVN